MVRMGCLERVCRVLYIGFGHRDILCNGKMEPEGRVWAIFRVPIFLGKLSDGYLL